MKTHRDFLKKIASFGASVFTTPLLLEGEREEDCFFSSESTSSMLVPMNDALKTTGIFLNEVSHDVPHQNWGEGEWEQDFRYMRDIGVNTVIMIRFGYCEFINLSFEALVKQGLLYAFCCFVVCFFCWQKNIT